MKRGKNYERKIFKTHSRKFNEVEIMKNNNIEYVIVNINGDFANVYDFCTPETAQGKIDKATENAQKEVKDYNGLITNYPDRADYWESCKKQYETAKYEMMTFDEFLKRQKKVMLSGEVTEVTKEDFYDALNILPPLKFCTRSNMEMFCMREMYTATYTTQYAYNLVNGKYYSAMVDATDETTWIYNRL